MIVLVAAVIMFIIFHLLSSSSLLRPSHLTKYITGKFQSNLQSQALRVRKCVWRTNIHHEDTSYSWRERGGHSYNSDNDCEYCFKFDICSETGFLVMQNPVLLQATCLLACPGRRIVSSITLKTLIWKILLTATIDMTATMGLTVTKV